MANRFYPKGAQKVLAGAIDFSADDIKVSMVDNGYTFSATHEFLSDLVANTVGTPQQLANPVITGGVLDANDLSFGPVATGPTVRALVIYKDTGSASTSPVLCYLDDIAGFPFPANGSEVNVTWSNATAKILSLV